MQDNGLSALDIPEQHFCVVRLVASVHPVLLQEPAHERVFESHWNPTVRHTHSWHISENFKFGWGAALISSRSCTGYASELLASSLSQTATRSATGYQLI